MPLAQEGCRRSRAEDPLAFAGLLAHVLLALMLSLHVDDAHRSLGVGYIWKALWTSPTAVVLILVMLVLLGAMVRLAHDAPGATRVVLGLVHSVLQLVASGAMIIAASRAASALGLRGVTSVIAFLAFLGLFGGFGGALGLAGYLWATNRLGFHANEAYAPLRIVDFKHFLRLHIDREGTLTIFPIGIDTVCRRWRLFPDAPPHAPWFVPADGEDLEAHLIEEPISLDGG